MSPFIRNIEYHLSTMADHLMPAKKPMTMFTRYSLVLSFTLTLASAALFFFFAPFAYGEETANFDSSFSSSQPQDAERNYRLGVAKLAEAQGFRAKQKRNAIREASAFAPNRPSSCESAWLEDDSRHSLREAELHLTRAVHELSSFQNDIESKELKLKAMLALIEVYALTKPIHFHQEMIDAAIEAHKKELPKSALCLARLKALSGYIKCCSQKYEDAIGDLKDALQVQSTSGTAETYAETSQTRYWLACCLIQLGEFENARKELTLNQEFLDYYKAPLSSRYETESLLAYTMYACEDFASAKKLLQSSLNDLPAEDFENQEKEQLEILSDLSNICMRMANYAEAEQYASNGLSLARNLAKSLVDNAKLKSFLHLRLCARRHLHMQSNADQDSMELKKLLQSEDRNEFEDEILDLIDETQCAIGHTEKSGSYASLTGFHPVGEPIKHTSVISVSINLSKYPSSEKENARRLIQSSFEEWNKQLGNHFTLKLTGVNDRNAFICIDQKTFPSIRRGFCYTRSAHTFFTDQKVKYERFQKRISFYDLSFNPRQSCPFAEQEWTSFLNRKWSAFERDLFKFVCLHEFGHALGLAHSAHSDSVMSGLNGTVKLPPATLSKFDSITVREVYGIRNKKTTASSPR